MVHTHNKVERDKVIGIQVLFVWIMSTGHSQVLYQHYQAGLDADLYPLEISVAGSSSSLTCGSVTAIR